MGFSVLAKFDAKDGISTIFDRMAQAGNKFSSKTGHNFNSINSHVEALKDKIGSLKNMLIGGLAGYFSLEGLKNLGMGIVSITAKFEQWRISFDTLLKSKSKADIFFESLKKFSTKTPFQMTDLVPAAKQLLGFGMQVNDIIPKLSRLSDLSMGSADKFTQLVYAYGKSYAIGITSMKELRMFSTAGVPIFNLLAKLKHTDKMGLLEMVKKRKITFDDINEALTKLTDKQGMFYNETKKQSQSLQGLWTTSLDIINNMGDTIGNHNGHLKNLKGSLKWFISNQDSVEKDVLKVVDALDKAFSYLDKTYKFIKNNWAAISPIVAGVATSFIALKFAEIGVATWTGICNFVMNDTTIALRAMYLWDGICALRTLNLAAAQTAFSTALSVSNAGLLIFIGYVGLLAAAYVAGDQLYKHWKPYHDLMDELADDIVKIQSLLGLGNMHDLKINTLKGSYSQDLHYDVLKNKYVPNKGKEWEFTQNKRGYYVPKLTQPGVAAMTSGSKSNQKSSIDINIKTDKGVKAVAKKKEAKTHSLNLRGAHAQ